MDSGHKPGLPIWAVILDVIGTLILVLGVLGLIGSDRPIFPEFLDKQAFSIVLIFAGVLLMVPLIIVVVRRATSQR